MRKDWPTRADGACVHLTADNTCAIYETRPMVCRVSESKPPGVTVERWYEANAEVCRELQQQEETNGSTD